MQQIIPGVWTFTGLIAGRVYALEGEDGLTIVDAGLQLAPPRILRQLEANGYTPDDVKRILITHGHPDHIGGLPELQSKTSAPVLCYIDEVPYVEGEAPLVRPPAEELAFPMSLIAGSEQTMDGTPVAHALTDGEVIPEVGLRVLHTPGHAPGHISFWDETRSLLIVGDVIFHVRGKMGLPFAAYTSDMAANIRSVKRLADLEPRVMLFGHGPPRTENARLMVRAFAESL